MRLSTERAGAYSQQLANRQFDSWVRSHKRLLLTSGLLWLALGGLMWLALTPLPSIRGLGAGAVVGAGFTLSFHFGLVASGASGASMGATAEVWTDSELRRMRRKGWRHVNHLVIRNGDIDHVAIGPDGVIVLETKWRSAEIDIDHPPPWFVDDAVRQAAKNKEDVGKLLNWWRRDDHPIVAAVVVWGPNVIHEIEGPSRINGVNIISGAKLREELGLLSDVRLSPTEIDEVYEKLGNRVEKVDNWESARAEPSEPTLGDLANRLIANVGVGLVSLFLTALSTQLGWWSIGAILALVAAGIVARRTERFRSAAVWWLVGIIAIAPATLIALAVQSW